MVSRARVVHPAVVATVVLAWLAFGAVLVGGVLFGQTARTAPPRRRTRSSSARLGLLVSLSGPWLVALAAAVAGAVTREWLAVAAIATGGLALTAVLGAALRPH